MSDITKIQWCDSTVNPIMGCGGCELFPVSPEIILHDIDQRLISQTAGSWEPGTARQLFQDLINDALRDLLECNSEPETGHSDQITTTNLYHLRSLAAEYASRQFGHDAGQLLQEIIERHVTCYAAKLHLNRGYSIIRPERKVNQGYAPTFEQVTLFPGRMQEAANWSNLTGTERPKSPWLNGLPRLIFVSDMGDAFSRKSDFGYLQQEICAIQTESGHQHLWLWLSKRPQLMREFAASIGGFPPNVCAMTTITFSNTLGRVDQLRDVDAQVKGLSIEPLWSPIADQVDLAGIDWVIVGGESGAAKNVAEFPVEWAIDLRRLCREQGVAFFCKQLGRRPTRGGEPINLADQHGGDWSEWDDDLRIREFPSYFYDYEPANIKLRMLTRF